MGLASSWRIGLLLLLASTAHAADDAVHSEQELSQLSLEDLLDVKVRVATKTELQAAQSPGVVTVVTAEEIEQRGYRSLAEVLRAVPGFYDVCDGVTHNIGIRGINGGQDASGNVLKLMIDGQPVDYRPTTGNFFGEELIPMQAIERIEIMRGPASALYGANAFLGVVNVITRSGGAIAGARLVAEGALVRQHLGGGGSVLLGGASGPLDVLVGANYLYLDRSGLNLPASSPILQSQPQLAQRNPSLNDNTQPSSLFAKLSLNNLSYGKLTFLATIQSVFTHGEFQSFGPLSHGTRITALNQNYRLGYEVEATSRLTLDFTGHYFNGAPTARARLDVGRPDYVMLPSLAADGGGFTAEGRIRAHRMFLLTVGVDFVQENHLLETFDQLLLLPVLAPGSTTVLRAAGTIIPGEQHGATSAFRNWGAFAQGILTPRREWTAVAGLRVDDHNIYGAQFSGRAGLVYARRALSLKLLFGSSFKAPSAEQLYAQPIGFGGIQGNPQLQAQTARTIETAAGYQLPGERGSISANLFATNIAGRVEFVPYGNFVQAQNIADEWLLGGELDSRFVVTRSLHLRFSTGIAHTAARRAGDALLGKPEVTNPLFPTYQLHFTGDYAFPWWGLRLSAECSFIGPRPASFSNSLLHGSAYEVGSYVYTALVLSSGGWHLLPGRESHVSLRVADVINQAWVEPGFGGIDIPTQGITALLTWIQGL